jgi:hypothetical protein
LPFWIRGRLKLVSNRVSTMIPLTMIAISIRHILIDCLT